MADFHSTVQCCCLHPTIEPTLTTLDSSIKVQVQKTTKRIAVLSWFCRAEYAELQVNTFCWRQVCLHIATRWVFFTLSLSFPSFLCPNDYGRSAHRAFKTPPCTTHFHRSRSSCNNLLCLQNLPHTHFSAQSPWMLVEESSLSYCTASTCLFWWSCISIFKFLSLRLLRQWAMKFLSQWNPILLLYAQECFSTGERQGVFTSLCLSPKSPLVWGSSIFSLCLYEWEETCHAELKAQLFLEVCGGALLSKPLLWLSS